MARPQGFIVDRIEKNVEKLEKMAYTKERDLALKLCGHIDEGVYCAEIPNSWETRVARALENVMAEPATVESADLGMAVALPPASEAVEAPPALAPAAAEVVEEEEESGGEEGSKQEVPAPTVSE